jgi:hypothetical protein
MSVLRDDYERGLVVVVAAETQLTIVSTMLTAVALPIAAYA